MEKGSKSVLHITELVDLAYDIAKEQFGDKFFSFTSIWSKVWKSASNFSKEKVETWIGYFYAELATDPRFTIYGFNNWKLREFVPLSELKRLERTIFSDETVFEEEYEVYMNSLSNKNKEVEMVATEDASETFVEDEEETSEDDENSEGVDKEDLFEAEDE